MRNYLKAELFRNFHRMYLWIYITCIVVCGTLGCLGFRYMNHYSGTNLTLEMLVMAGVGAIAIYIYIVMLFADITMGEEIKNNTIKNIVSSGLSREKIYICKLIVSIVLMIFCTVVSLIGTLLIGYLMLGVKSSMDITNVLKDCIMRGSIAVVLWSGAIALAMLIFTLIKNNTVAAFIYAGLMMFTGQLLDLLGRHINPIFSKMLNGLLSVQLGQIALSSNLSNENIITAIVLGVIYIVVTTMIGIGIFKIKDV